MHIHLRVHHWVIWWFYVGVVCGVVALVNIFSRNLTRSQEDVVLALGAIHWILGGLVCYSREAIRIVPRRDSPSGCSSSTHEEDEREWHPASDFLQPGSHQHLLPR